MYFTPASVCHMFLAGLLFGLYFASFLHCLRWLLLEDSGWMLRTKTNRTMMSITTIIFISVTVATVRIVPFYLGRSPDPTSSSGNIVYQLIFNSPFLQYLVLLLIDGVMIYRCWIMFSKSLRTIFLPVAAWCSSLLFAIIDTICSFPIFSFSAHGRHQYPELCKIGFFQWQTPLVFMCCNIAITAYTTAAIVSQIRHTTRSNNARSNTGRLYRIGRILTESGILYTSSSAFTLVSMSFYLSSPHSNPSSPTSTTESVLWFNNASSVLVTFLPSIAFNLILIQVGEQRGNGEDTQVSYNSERAL